jgi:hypothetical protein
MNYFSAIVEEKLPSGLEEQTVREIKHLCQQQTRHVAMKFPE